jgi:hypothetical protein
MGRIHVGALTGFSFYPGRRMGVPQLVYGKTILSINIGEYSE